VGESLVLTVGGALVGAGGAKLLYGALALRKIGTYVWADMRMRPETFLFCMALSFVLGFLSASWPAYRAARINIAEALRSVG
jgi:ABC-type antimicrobial peptide transport system permease subunit